MESIQACQTAAKGQNTACLWKTTKKFSFDAFRAYLGGSSMASTSTTLKTHLPSFAFLSFYIYGIFSIRFLWFALFGLFIYFFVFFQFADVGSFEK